MSYCIYPSTIDGISPDDIFFVDSTIDTVCGDYSRDHDACGDGAEQMQLKYM